MSWPHAILTDSGGYQVFSLSGLRKIDERRGGFPIAPERRPAHVHAGIHRGCATRLRQRHPDGAGRMSGVSGRATSMRAKACTARSAGRARPSNITAGSTGARQGWMRSHALVPHRAGIDVRRPAARVRHGPARAGRGRLRHRRPFGGRAAAAQPGDGGGHRRHSAARTGRATPWAWACRTNCRNTWPGAWT